MEQAGLTALGTLVFLFATVLLAMLGSAVLYGYSAASKLEKALKPDEKWRGK